MPQAVEQLSEASNLRAFAFDLLFVGVDDQRVHDGLDQLHNLEPLHKRALAVGAPGDAKEGSGAIGAVWILFLKKASEIVGSDYASIVQAHQKISASEFDGDFMMKCDNAVPEGAQFGHSVAWIGDFGDAPTPRALAVGADHPNPGIVYILFLNSDGTVYSCEKIDNAALEAANNLGAPPLDLVG